MRQLAGVLLVVCVCLPLGVSLVESRRQQFVPSFCRQFIDQTQSANSTDDVDDDVDDEEFDEDDDELEEELEEEGEGEQEEEVDEETGKDIDEDEDVMRVAVEEIDMLNMLVEFMA